MLRRCVQGIFRYRSKPRTTSTELQPLCDAQMRHPLTSSGLISEPYTWNANYEVEGVGCLNQIKLRYNTHIYIWLYLYLYIHICMYMWIYIYIEDVPSPAPVDTGNIPICRLTNVVSTPTGSRILSINPRHETLRMWFGRTAFAAGWFLCYCRAGKGGGRPKFLLNFSPSLQSFSEIRKGQERSFKNFVFSSISFMICIGYRLTSTSHTRELRRPFVYINAALGCFGMGNPTKIAIIHHPAAW